MSAPAARQASPGTADVVIVGGGAAGLATAIFCARQAPGLSVAILDGARRVGAKILVSGGSRCNVTNRTVTEHDFWGGSPRVVRSVLRAFPAPKVVEFFAALGVALHEEEDGKLFPDTNRARTVLDALLREVERLGVVLECGSKVVDVRREAGGLTVTAASGETHEARAVVLATGGRSLPKSGSDGSGYGLAARLGHGYVETTPALVPLVLGTGDSGLGVRDSGFGTRGSGLGARDSGLGIQGLRVETRPLAGVSHPARITVRTEGRRDVRLDGSLLWTHVGISGPVALNASRHWHRAQLEHRPVQVVLTLCPGETLESLDAWLQAQALEHPRAHVATVLSRRLPAAVADAWAGNAGLAGVTLAHLQRDARRHLVQRLLATPLAVRDSRGYAVAEVTAGGIPLDEIDPATMASKRCPGLYLVGEILDVDGRLGGFNFQWSWSSAWVAGRAIAAALTAPPGCPGA